MTDFNLYCGEVLEVLRTFDDAQVRCVVTSPPYWGLRDYGTGKWEGGDPSCAHKYANPAQHVPTRGVDPTPAGHREDNERRRPMLGACRWCGAERVDQQLGLEPTPHEYVERMVEIFRELRRVLTDDGSVWLNLGDSFVTRPGQMTRGGGPPSSSSTLQGHGHKGGGPKMRSRCETETGIEQMRKMQGNESTRHAMYRFRAGVDFDPKAKHGLTREDGRPNRRGVNVGLKHKDLIGVPWRVAFGLQDDGWYLRDDIIWCLSGGSWLYAKTQKGEAPAMLKDLVKLRPETVKLWNGTKWTQVLNWRRSTDEGTKYELVFRSGERVGCTARHVWPTQRGNVETKNLTIGDRVVSCKLPDASNARPGYLIDDAIWLAGLFLAEGSWADDTIQLGLNADEEEWLPRIQRVADHFNGSMTYTLKGNALSVRLYGKLLVALFESFVQGRLSDEVRIRASVWALPDADLRLFAEGYLDGDGHWDPANDRWRLGFTRNYALERDLRVLAARLGATITLKPCFGTNQTKKRYPAFRGEWRWGRSGHFNERDRGEIVELRRSRARQFWDLEVEDEPHLFSLASGVLTHNCKKNPLPESVKDRPTRAHEYVFLLSKSPSYYYDYESVKEPTTGTAKPRGKGVHPKAGKNELGDGAYTERRHRRVDGFNERWQVRANASFSAAVTEVVEKRNLRDVWTLASQPYKGAHYAVMPEKLVEPCVLAGSAPGDIVLDPFCGSGTVGVVALRHGRSFVGIDLAEKNMHLAWERITGSQIARRSA